MTRAILEAVVSAVLSGLRSYTSSRPTQCADDSARYSIRAISKSIRFNRARVFTSSS